MNSPHHLKATGSPSEEVAALIADYCCAYEAANGNPAPEVSFNRGWFKVGSFGPRYRRKQIEQFRDTLRSRPLVK